jgi:hypothetical protein
MAHELPPDETPRRNRYIQWGRYDTGRPWVLVQGEDFDRTPDRAARALRQWAYVNQRQVTVEVFEDRIKILIHPKGADQ